MNHKGFLTSVLVLSIIAATHLVAGAASKIGTPLKTQLDYRKGRQTSAEITLTGVQVDPEGSTIRLKVYITYTNTGKRSIYWNFFDTAVLDDQGRQYEGKAATTEYTFRSTVDFISDLDPGLTKKTYLYFTLPKSAVKGNLRFCFLKFDKNYTPQGIIQIYNKQRSSYKFDQFKYFESVIWK